MPSRRERSDSPRERYDSRGERESRREERGYGKEREDRKRRRDHDDDRYHRHERSDRSDRYDRNDRSDGHKRDEEYDRSSNRQDRHRSPEPEPLDLRKLGIKQISGDDFFIKSGEFKYWLRKERGRYLDEMSSDSARKYFRRFVRRWNDGVLREEYYRPVASTSGNTAYKWQFSDGRSTTSHRSSRPPSPAPRPIAGDVHDPLVTDRPLADADSSDSEIVGPTLPATSHGPTVPTAGDRRLAYEESQEADRAARKANYKSKRREAYEKADELVPKQVGKEGKMAEKRASNAANKEMRDKDVGGLEVDEGVLMGSEGSSFQQALKARDAAMDRRADKRGMEMADRRAAMEERMAERKQKEAANMEMLRAMAKQRFG